VIRLRFRPPVGDASWDSWINDGRAAVQRMLAGPTDQARVDPALYKRQRDRLLEATNRKCAYCELLLTPGQRKGDVEHYRPKGRVRGLDGKVVKVWRDGVEIDHPGYFWLAYDYLNLLPACIACNRRAGDSASGTQTGKSDIFPTLDGQWAVRPEDVAIEQPALLNPWLDGDDPADHLKFDSTTGVVMGLTDRGITSVELLGLNRDGLPEARKKACREVRHAYLASLTDIAQHQRAEESDLQVLRDVESGAAEFAAVGRVELARRFQAGRQLEAAVRARATAASATGD
jgi:hypothetical protein